MPNWCSNDISFEINSNDKVIKYLNEIEINFNKGNLNNFLIPRVENFTENRCNWGTKWDINSYHFLIQNNYDYIRVDCSFDTAWGPNIPVSKVLFESLKEIGDVKFYNHLYSEPGCAFHGKFDGVEDQCEDMNMMFYIQNDHVDYHTLEKNENDILKFEELDNLFLIKRQFKKDFSYFGEKYTLDCYECFSETYGDNIVFYKYNDLFYSTGV